MKNLPNLDSVVLARAFRGEDKEDTDLIHALLRTAREYLSDLPWCEAIEEEYVGIAVGDVIGVFLFHIVPAQPNVDDWVWVITGDIPPAYIAIEDATKPAQALDGYIGALEEWIAAVRAGKSVDDLIPVNAPPTFHYAEMLDSRLRFLDKEILAPYSDQLEE